MQTQVIKSVPAGRLQVKGNNGTAVLLLSRLSSRSSGQHYQLCLCYTDFHAQCDTIIGQLALQGYNCLRFAMRRQRALLGMRDLALLCKLFDTLVFLILSYACKVWREDIKCGAAAEALH